MIALLPVRDGVLPTGAADAAAECGGRVLLVGTGLDDARAALGAAAVEVVLAPSDAAFGRLVAALAVELAGEDVVVLPTSPDGRDLAPVLARAMGRPLVAGALSVGPNDAVTTSWGGRLIEDVTPGGPYVATLQPSGGAPAGGATADAAAADEAATATGPATTIALRPDDAPVATTTAVLPPDVTSMDLAEAPRILGGGAGLDGAERFTQLASVAAALGAAMGGTRVITDRGWIGHERQIGTTGVSVRPGLYLAFGVSGAVQHTAGLGDPDHVVSVNTDPHCPMMQLADLALVADANATLDALARLLEVEP